MRNLLVLLLLISFWTCKEATTNTALEPTVIPFTKQGELSLYKAKTDSLIVQLDIEIASTDYDIQTGLMYRNGMAENQAMLFVFDDEQPRSFYMKNTRFPLDIIYLNTAKKIISIQKNAQPLNQNSLPSYGNAQYVLEINAGLANKWGLEPMDYISYTTSK